MSKLSALVAGGIGYVLGARAGRERYEQIQRAASKVRSNPTVQSTARHATEAAKDAAPVVKDKVAGAADSATSSLKKSDGPDLEGSSYPRG